MSQQDEDLSEIGAALALVHKYRQPPFAPHREATSLRDAIKRLKRDMAISALDSVAASLKLRELECSLVVAEKEINCWPGKLVEALARLRALNGVVKESWITADVYDLVLRRLAQGFRTSEVAFMAWCTPGTVSNIKSGRYPLSTKTQRWGSRSP